LVFLSSKAQLPLDLTFDLAVGSRCEVSAICLITVKRASHSAATRAIEHVAASSRSGRTAPFDKVGLMRD
jgi:hypothetical protein